MYKTIQADKQVGRILQRILNWPSGSQLFCPAIDESENIVSDWLDNNGTKVTGIVRSTATEIAYEHIHGNSKSFLRNEDFSVYKPEDRFHFSFCVPPFSIDFQKEEVRRRTVEDAMLNFKCSEGKKNREAPVHMIMLEQMLRATFLGGFFAAVLPAKWAGREVKYLTWWRGNAADVATIKLPSSAVVYKTERLVKRRRMRPYFDGYVPHELDIDYEHRLKYNLSNLLSKKGDFYRMDPLDLSVPGEWVLKIFFRPYNIEYDSPEAPYSEAHSNKLEWALLRWPEFVYKLESLSYESIDALVNSFKESEWHKNSIFQWQKMLKRFKEDRWCGTTDWAPRGSMALPDTQDMWLFEPSEENTSKVRVCSDVNEIKRTPNSIHIKLTRSNTKLIGYSPHSQVVSHELMSGDGYTEPTYQNPERRSKFAVNFLDRDYASVREVLLQKITLAGCVPCMTENDVTVNKKRSRWLDIQLAPIERSVPVITVKSDGKTEKNWETLYEETGMKSVFPNIMEQWRQRALKMRMDKYLFPFQFEDILYYVAKQSYLNGNGMGLGKTRETFFAAILRGVDKFLIVCPTKLIGTWCDEFTDCIVPYAMAVKRHWSGKLLNVGQPNIIENGIDWNKDAWFTVIGYDKLKATPRDGRFYKCPECDMVVYTASGKPQRCPGRSKDYDADPEKDNSCLGPYRRWKARCKERDEETGKLKYQKYKVQKSTGKKVHWDENHRTRVFIPESDVKVVDTRDQIEEGILPGKPSIPLMKEQTTMFHKMRDVFVRNEENYDASGVKVQIPVYKQVKKKQHVKWTHAEIARNMFNMIGVDEIQYIMNEDSQRTGAVDHLCAVSRAGMTGTPMKGYPQSVVSYLNWLIDRVAFPNYRSHVPGGKARFINRYKTTVTVGVTKLEDGSCVGGKLKQIPKIKNPDLFQAELAPIMRRHLRTEPEVKKDIPEIPCTREDIFIPMDSQHKAYYQMWLEMFGEWWQKMKEEEEGRNVKPGEILAKMQWLIGASTCPHYIFKNLSKAAKANFNEWLDQVGRKKWAKIIKPYTGPYTQKMVYAIKKTIEAKKNGDKILIFSSRNAVSDMLNHWFIKNNMYSLVVDGRTSLKNQKRHAIVQEFRERAYDVMPAGLGALAEGMNIPEANHGIIHDVGWEPSWPLQAIGRMLRPQQTKHVYSYFLMHEGTIDEYMGALCYLKGRSHEEGVDYMEFDDLSTEIIPDIMQYTESVVDGTHGTLKREMWLAVEHIKKQWEEEGVNGGSSDI